MAQKLDFKDRKLYRSQENRMIGGVCGGLAEYFQIDPTLVRLIWIATALFGGIGVIVYIASLIIVPANPIHGAVFLPTGSAIIFSFGISGKSSSIGDFNS